MTRISEQDVGLSPHVSKQSNIITKDAEALAKLGYEQEFDRGFSIWSVASIAFAQLGLLPSIASILGQSLGVSGTPGLTWAWLIALIGIMSVCTSVSELCSSMPTSGGLYYASAVLAPRGWGPFTAWVTCWSNWIAFLAAAPSINYGMAAMTLSLKSVADPSYSPENYQIFLLTIGIMIAQAILSSAPTKALARFNLSGMVLNGVAFFVAIIIILAVNNRDSPKFNSSPEVWGEITNQSDYPDGMAIIISFTAPMWTMSGYISPYYLAEECVNASVSAPWAMVLTALSGGILGWALQVVLAYTITDLSTAMDSSLGQPFVTCLQQCLPQSMVYFITALTILAAFFMGQAAMIGTSRLTFAYARDGCVPLSKYWSRVNKWTKTPVNAVWFNCLIGCCLLLLILAGPETIAAIFTIVAIAGHVSFVLPVAMKVLFVPHFRYGPFNLGKLSRPVGAFSVLFVIFMMPILCMPTARGDNLTPQNMNWTAVVYFVPLTISILWYALFARKWFKGPKISFDHMVHEVEGVDVDMPVSNTDSLGEEKIG